MSDIDNLARLYRTNRTAYIKAVQQQNAGAAARQYLNMAAQQNTFGGLAGMAGLMGTAAMQGFGSPPPTPTQSAPSRGREEIGAQGAKNTSQLVSACAPVESISEHHQKHEEWLEKLRSRPHAKP